MLTGLADVIGNGVATRFFERLLVWLFPADPADVLNSQELEAIAPKAQRFDRTTGRLIFAGSLMAFGLIGIFLRWMDQLSRMTVKEPVWDNIDGWALFFPALFLGLASGINLARLHARLHWGRAIRLYDRYQATVARWDHRRAWVWLSRVFVTSGAFLVVVCWHAGESIGNDAIVFKDGLWTVRRYSHDDVVRLGRYTRLHAPIGIVDYANLEIVFDDGRVLRLRHRRGQQDAAQLDELADYISTRSTVPVIHGDLPECER